MAVLGEIFPHFLIAAQSLYLVSPIFIVLDVAESTMKVQY